MAKQQIAHHIIKALQGLSLEEKAALCADIQSANGVQQGITYSTLIRYLNGNHFILTHDYNQRAIRKALQLPDNYPILSTFKKGKWVPDSTIEEVAQ